MRPSSATVLKRMMDDPAELLHDMLNASGATSYYLSEKSGLPASTIRAMRNRQTGLPRVQSYMRLVRVLLREKSVRDNFKG